LFSHQETPQIDLGCCCICHDSVEEGVATDCAWCVGCSVNKLTTAEADQEEPKVPNPTP